MQIVEGLRGIFSYLKAKASGEPIVAQDNITYGDERAVDTYDLVYRKWVEDYVGDPNAPIVEGIYVDSTTFTDYDNTPLDLYPETIYVDIAKQTSYYFDTEEEELFPLTDPDAVPDTRQILTDPTLKGGGDLSEDRTLGIADNMIPATATVFNGDLNTLVDVGERICNNIAANTIANNYPVEGFTWSITVQRVNQTQGLSQTIIGRNSTRKAMYIRDSSNMGTTWSAWSIVATGGGPAQTVNGTLYNKFLTLFTNGVGALVIKIPKIGYTSVNHKNIKLTITEYGTVPPQGAVLNIDTFIVGSPSPVPFHPVYNKAWGYAFGNTKNIINQIRFAIDTDNYYVVIGNVDSIWGGGSRYIFLEQILQNNSLDSPYNVTASLMTDLTALEDITGNIQTELLPTLSDVAQKAGDTMTGTLDLASGTTTEAPIKIPTGTLTTVPQDGAIERDVNGDYFVTIGVERLRLASFRLNEAPAFSGDTGRPGEIRVTSTHIYVCIATDTWVRTELTTW